jgi:hypothetical protein
LWALNCFWPQNEEAELQEVYNKLGALDKALGGPATKPNIMKKKDIGNRQLRQFHI